jgi:tRNA (guanine-N7-)-methyltransferase
MRLRNIPEAKDIVAQSPYVIKNPAERKGSWKTFSDKPLYVEIGTGKGRFLM